MNRSSALQFDLSLHAAAVADASILVKARIVEAADTIAHLDVGGLRPARVKSLWPVTVKNAIGGHDPSYGMDDARAPYIPPSSAISRAEEVSYGWMLQFVHDDERRIILGKWAMCLAVPGIFGSFRTFCKETGRVRRTAERRIDQQINAIAAAILKNAQSLQAPNWSRVSPLMPNQGRDFDMVATSTHWMQADAKPQHRPEMLDPLRRNAA